MRSLIRLYNVGFEKVVDGMPGAENQHVGKAWHRSRQHCLAQPGGERLIAKVKAQPQFSGPEIDGHKFTHIGKRKIGFLGDQPGCRQKPIQAVLGLISPE